MRFVSAHRKAGRPMDRGVVWASGTRTQPHGMGKAVGPCACSDSGGIAKCDSKINGTGSRTPIFMDFGGFGGPDALGGRPEPKLRVHFVCWRRGKGLSVVSGPRARKDT